MVHTSGEAGAKALTHSGLPVDLRIVPEEAFGNLLQHFTGSGRHNEALRTAAVKRGLHVSEYGIADDESGDSIACATEEEVYERLGMQWIPPELRENRGELEAAREGGLPDLIELADIRGDLHMHTTALGRPRLDRGDGARRRAERGYDYLAITDHSASARVRQRRARRTSCASRSSTSAALELDGIAVLAGTETNVLPDGSLDYDGRRARAARLGRSPASTRSFRLSEKEQTERMLPRDGAPAGRRDRPPHRPADRAPRALRARHRPA